jgi:hypothetical protein
MPHLQTSAGRVAYPDTGSGPMLVLLHATWHDRHDGIYRPMEVLVWQESRPAGSCCWVPTAAPPGRARWRTRTLRGLAPLDLGLVESEIPSGISAVA